MIIPLEKIANLAVASSIMISLSEPIKGPGYMYEKTSSGDEIVRLKSCPSKSNCVSSGFLEPPNRYVSPLKLVNDRDVAFQRAVKDLQQNRGDFSIAELDPKAYYIHFTTPGTAPGSVDDIEFTFPEGSGIVNIRCEAQVSLPPPPFCVKKNCINGNMDQRSRINKVALLLNLPPSDQEQMNGAKWTPIFFNADKVPDMVDYYD